MRLYLGSPSRLGSRVFLSWLLLAAVASCGLVQTTPNEDAGAGTDAGAQARDSGSGPSTDAARDAPDADVAVIDATVPAKIVRVAGGDAAHCFLFSNGKAKCCGWGIYGAMGQGRTDDMCVTPTTVGAQLPWIDLGANRSVKSLASDGTHVCALLENNRVKCWGGNNRSELGYVGEPRLRGAAPGEMGDALPEIALAEPAQAVYVSLGVSCALLTSGKLKCWGANAGGQLGAGTDVTVLVSDPPVDVGTGHSVRSITLSGAHTCAILDDNRVKCWGFNHLGQLGLEDRQARGDGPNEMGDNLAYVDLGTGRTATQVAAMPEFSCALLDNGAVKCWGGNTYGQLGMGRTDETWGDKPGQMGDNLPEIRLGTALSAKQIAVQGNSACALLSNDQVKCWGSRTLGVAATAPQGIDVRGRDPNDMGDNLPFVELGTGRTAKSISMGDGLCVILDNDRVKCWGGNGYGSLGYGDRVDRWGGPAYSGDAMPYVDLGN